jgi:mRNA-degrading endonuclease toxin of MazEF toxin-antitoxin module
VFEWQHLSDAESGVRVARDLSPAGAQRAGTRRWVVISSRDARDYGSRIDVSCACHWATSAAAGERTGHLVTTAYSVAPGAIMVPPESPARPLGAHVHPERMSTAPATRAPWALRRARPGTAATPFRSAPGRRSPRTAGSRV